MKNIQESANNISQQLAKVSMHYGDLIKNAKTATKRAYFTKKLKRNNILISDILIPHS